MQTPTPVAATGAHFYNTQALQDLSFNWLRDIILKHRLYLPTVDQLNDPAELSDSHVVCGQAHARISAVSEPPTLRFGIGARAAASLLVTQQLVQAVSSAATEFMLSRGDNASCPAM
jgi:hypothetical protein